jgi:tripartite-type tricarboxylate transporter receptor subunit TctC
MIQSVVAGHTPIAFSSMPPAAGQIQAGTLRPLAVTGEKRIDSLPDVPTLIEAGYPGQTGETPVGIYVQTGTPKEIAEILRRSVVKMIALPDVKQRLAAVGFVPVGDTPEEFAAFLKAEDAKWGKVIRDGNIKVQ